nr:MAG TPA: hypothetical protein [Caudoviricetes sp.]
MSAFFPCPVSTVDTPLPKKRGERVGALLVVFLDFPAFLSRARARGNRCDVAQILTKG